MPDARTPGERLYHRWCGSSETDQARYFTEMNRACAEDWERLGTEFEALLALEAATRRLDDLFGGNLARWVLDGRPVTDAAAEALLIIHDSLKDVLHARSEEWTEAKALFDERRTRG